MRAPLTFLLLLCLWPIVGSTHARLLPNGNVPPRNTSAGLKTGPCGGVARTNTPTTLEAGQQFTIEWEETVEHPGRYEFYFSRAGDSNFELLLMVQDTQNDRATLPHRYSGTIQMPDIECEACTLQMIQVMTENPTSPRNYYSCADIALVRDAMVPTPPPNTPPPTEEPEQEPLTCDHE